ncbi:MAG: Hpt domain-containing protein [Bryobacteraceae bacterium]
MNTLRVLLVDEDPDHAARTSSLLSQSNHKVFVANGMEEGSEALLVQKFDAVLLASAVTPKGLAEFTATLRSLDRSQRGAPRTPVLAFSQQASGQAVIDEYLPEHFEPAALGLAIERLSYGNPYRCETADSEKVDLPIFEPDKFQAQVCHDRELAIEIIDLFLIERLDEMAEMRTALATGNYPRLCRAAHSIKGSLSSLHAALARSHAQDLESSANRKDERVCRFSLAALEHDLDALEPQLLALRDSPGTL